MGSQSSRWWQSWYWNFTAQFLVSQNCCKTNISKQDLGFRAPKNCEECMFSAMKSYQLRSMTQFHAHIGALPATHQCPQPSSHGHLLGPLWRAGCFGNSLVVEGTVYPKKMLIFYFSQDGPLGRWAKSRATHCNHYIDTYWNKNKTRRLRTKVAMSKWLCFVERSHAHDRVQINVRACLFAIYIYIYTPDNVLRSCLRT